MARNPQALIDDIQAAQDRLHAKWWEIASWLAIKRGADPLRLSPEERIAYAAEIRELTDQWDDESGKPLNATTELQILLADYYEITDQLEQLHDELDDLDED